MASPAPRSAWRTAPNARGMGTATRSGETQRSLSTRMPAPARTAATASVPRVCKRASSPDSPLAAAHVAAMTAARTVSRPTRAASSPGVSTGLESLTNRAWAGVASRSDRRAPSQVSRRITSFSRSGSMGGLVTCAKRWAK
ncbi:hypothetical protein D3C72_914420 [compost metagenome]